MDERAVLAAYDEQIRRHPGTDGHVEHEDHVIRSFGQGWTGVEWSSLDTAGADAVIAAQIAAFGARAWEWKHYDHDQPTDLPARLVAAGLIPEPAETLLVAEIADLDLTTGPPDGVTLVPVVDQAGIDDLVAVHDAVFGGDHSPVGRVLLEGLEREPSTLAAVVAMAGPVPVSAARVQFHEGTEFASLWGGGTRPEWRGRGVFRALVAHRAALAAARGFRYVQVDATADSRPILRGLGFVELATTTPFKHPGTMPVSGG
ncbi:GNAT family N-acetyltransferase [Umezawaea sp. Da 62-37]|uniref:GNAT family N-acetyltransferase n=1 Tax=Umezawaea sp. Da 62-37 TaxID=3075927 RepID=UPI0028F72D24|nr:GNAT family N-acetyltransferase [Umezawaea sp. Da 62-37]WNV86544.1 GNAT family N-acetyltransferase [Umezawaea sp. Da 62-37]